MVLSVLTPGSKGAIPQGPDLYTSVVRKDGDLEEGQHHIYPLGWTHNSFGTQSIVRPSIEEVADLW